MSLVKLKDRRTGTTYVYESESYWDKEKKQPRSHRKLIGKLDDETGEIIPTGKSGRKKSSEKETGENTAPDQRTEYIQALKAENQALHKQKQDILKTLEALCQRLAD